MNTVTLTHCFKAPEKDSGLCGFSCGFFDTESGFKDDVVCDYNMLCKIDLSDEEYKHFYCGYKDDGLRLLMEQWEGESVLIPDWCPLLDKNGENKSDFGEGHCRFCNEVLTLEHEVWPDDKPCPNCDKLKIDYRNAE